RSSEADANGLSARRNPVHAQHGAAAQQTAAADRALPAHDGVDVVMSDVPVGANAGRKQSRRGHRANARVLYAGNGAVSLEGAADDAEHGIECLDRRLVERMENAIAERCARAVSLTVRRPLCGELLSPDRWLSDRKNGSRR